jgi:hypothetical protein
MTNPGRFDIDESLEQELASLGAGIDYPPTPDLVTRVRGELGGSTARTWRSLGLRRLRLSLVLALVALMVAVSIAAALFYGLGGLRIVFVQELPSVAPESVAPGSLGAGLGLGQDTNLADAAARVNFTVLVPTAAELTPPDMVYFDDQLVGGQVSLVYGPGPGRPPPTGSGVSILVTEFSGGLEEKLAQKSVGPGTRVQIITVNDGTGFWIEGEPHVLVYRNPDGTYVHDSIRLVHNALAWEQDGVVVRIEGDLSVDEAVALASTFGPR